MLTGIVVSIHTSIHSGLDRIYVQGRLIEATRRLGRTFGIVFTQFKPYFFVQSQHIEKVRVLLRNIRGVSVQDLAKPSTRQEQDPWHSMWQIQLSRIRFKSSMVKNQAYRILRSAKIPCYEGDIPLYQQFLIEKNIALMLNFSAELKRGRCVDIRSVNPRIQGEKQDISLQRASQRDIIRHLRTVCVRMETQGTKNSSSQSRVQSGARIRSIVIANADGQILARLCPPVPSELAPSETVNAVVKDREEESEKRTIATLQQQIRKLDPDVLVFDRTWQRSFAFLLERMKALGISPRLGRSDRSFQLDQHAGQGYTDRGCYELDGRLVVESAHCNSASAVELADALRLRFQRALLCGTKPASAFGSVLSFEQLYISALHGLKIAAPDRGVDALKLSESPGGTIIQAESAVHRGVIVLDFKGLYPSIIRSFGIDPLAHITALLSGRAHINKKTQECIQSPNGAQFVRKRSILPKILDSFYAKREEAKKNADEASSYAYKILANSFYGVLASSSCRFAGSDIATAITAHAREILLWSKKFAEDRNFRVIYGDTDSLFVVPARVIQSKNAKRRQDLFKQGLSLSRELNAALAEWMLKKYSCTSHLEIEVEEVFDPLYIPPVKYLAQTRQNSVIQKDGRSGLRGRAKNYAGISYDSSGTQYNFVIKGMEAVRSDWTSIARSVQREVLRMLLLEEEPEKIREFLRKTIQGMRSVLKASLDSASAHAPDSASAVQLEDFYITKRLSKEPSMYRAGLPAHVRAALIAEHNARREEDALSLSSSGSRGSSGSSIQQAERDRAWQKDWSSSPHWRERRRISYIMTKDGPYPVPKGQSAGGGESAGEGAGQRRNILPDVDWYIEKQIVPVLTSISSSFDIGHMLSEVAANHAQLTLDLG